MTRAQIFRRKGVTGTRLFSRASFARHTHDAFGIGVIEAGAHRSWSGRGRVEAGAGDLITVNPGEVHDGAPIGDSRRWRMLYFSPAIIAGLADDLSEGRTQTLEFSAPVFAESRAARALFLALFQRTAGGEEADALAAETALLRLLPLVSAGAVKRGAALPTISRAKAMIDAAPEQAISLGALAQLSGSSRFQFLRAFRRATGLTPHAYIVQVRLQRARRLIESGESIAAAAAACGFSDQSHLTRVFARSYGFTPGRLSAISFKTGTRAVP